MLEAATARMVWFLVREVGGDHLRSAGHRTWVASYDSERLLSHRERSLNTSLAITPPAPRVVIMAMHLL